MVLNFKHFFMLLPITIDPTKKLFSCPCSPCVGIAAQLQQFINKRPKVLAKPAKTSGNFVLLDGVELAVYLARQLSPTMDHL